MKVAIYRFKSNGVIKNIEILKDKDYERLKSNPELIFNYNTTDNYDAFVFILDSEDGKEFTKEFTEELLKYACSKKNITMGYITEKLNYIIDDIEELRSDFNLLKDDVKLLEKQV